MNACRGAMPVVKKGAAYRPVGYDHDLAADHGVHIRCACQKGAQALGQVVGVEYLVQQRPAWCLNQNCLVEKVVRDRDCGGGLTIKDVAKEGQTLVVVRFGYLSIASIVPGKAVIGYNEPRVVHICIGIANVGEDVDQCSHVPVSINRVSQDSWWCSPDVIVVEVDVVALEWVRVQVSVHALVGGGVDSGEDRLRRDDCRWCLHRG